MKQILTRQELEELEDESTSESLVQELSRSAGLGAESGSESLVQGPSFVGLSGQLESDSLESNEEFAELSISLIWKFISM